VLEEPSNLRVVLLMSSLTAIASVSCIRLDEDHCIVNGGDFACEAGRMCVTETEAFTELSDEGDGCIKTAGIDYEFDKYFVHVQYGLPDSLAARGEAEDDLRSVTGILARAVGDRGLEEVCTVGEMVVRDLEPLWIEVNAVREFLDRPSRVRAETATLGVTQVEAIGEFNGAINAWLEECH
jgi:hypothetical protein